ncbi:MAG: hypothetical protein AAB278_07245, partial [Pseudomonadota bacterium]
NNMTRGVYFTGAGAAGADGIWFTADDSPSGYSSSTYDANGNLIRGENFFGVSAFGVDGIWFTADDVISSEATYQTF